MFKEISKMEQCYDAVLMVIRDGFCVSEVSEQWCKANEVYSRPQ